MAKKVEKKVKKTETTKTKRITPTVKKKEYSVFKKKSGRYSVVARGGKLINAEKKVEILAKEGLITIKKSTKKPELTAVEAPAEGA